MKLELIEVVGEEGRRREEEAMRIVWERRCRMNCSER
jgi:hypothetical protein